MFVNCFSPSSGFCPAPFDLLASSAVSVWRVNMTLAPKSSLFLFVLSLWTLEKKKVPQRDRVVVEVGETALKKNKNITV